jgi:HSP20 family protein
MTTQSATVMQRVKEAEPVKHNGKEIADRCSQMVDAIARRAFEIFESRGGSPGHDMEDWFRAESELLHSVLLETTESNDEFIVRVEAPGFDREDIEIKVEPRSLAISGERETSDAEENEKMILSESSADRIFRSLALLADVDPAEVSTPVKDGILTGDLPKAQITQ